MGGELFFGGKKGAFPNTHIHTLTSTPTPTYPLEKASVAISKQHAESILLREFKIKCDQNQVGVGW